ncbi:hypothetical protein BTR23_18615 [Alkalihalophilus pseudofirmus]|nr:hypothetical protein BTR23_18615 [Alkalihalophilus pseudofirmus]
MIKGIDHIEICVGEIDKMADFFKKLGFTEVRRTDHHGGAVEMLMPGEQGIIFEFHVGKAVEAPGINHIAFKVDDIDETYSNLQAVGVEFIAPPKKSSNRGTSMLNLRDPYHMRYQFTD